ncbi:MAG: type II toxin-antitoxin system antitoxin SocA domain-containing protein [Bacteroidota bacterium]
MSPLKLQKLLYYAQAWHYTLFDEALIDEEFQAWKHGPVAISQYYRFADINYNAPILVEKYNPEIIDFPENVEKLLVDVNNIYGEHQASYLEQLTHSEEPWITARAGLPSYESCSNVISLESMSRFYSKMLQANGQ